MLKGIDPLLSADVLYRLAIMGHGDQLAIVDGNFPADSVAAHAPARWPLRLPGVTTDALLAAILTVFPLDDFTDDPVQFMQIVGSSSEKPEAVVAMEAAARMAGYAGGFKALERSIFYAVAKGCFGIIQCGENRLYGNVILRKGIVRV